jgi:hypothetical protein
MQYIRTARVNKRVIEIPYNRLVGRDDAIEGDWHTIIDSKTFDTFAQAQKRLDNEVEFLYIDKIERIMTADMNRKVAFALGIPEKEFGDCI